MTDASLPSPPAITSERRDYTLDAELSAEDFRGVLRAGAEACAVVEFVVRPSLPLVAAGQFFLESLHPYLHSTFDAPAEGEHHARVFRYVYSRGVIDRVGRAASSIYDWRQPDRPEDLALLRADGSRWLSSDARGRRVIFTLSDPERARLVDQVPPLAVALKAS